MMPYFHATPYALLLLRCWHINEYARHAMPLVDMLHVMPALLLLMLPRHGVPRCRRFRLRLIRHAADAAADAAMFAAFMPMPALFLSTSIDDTTLLPLHALPFAARCAPRRR